MGMEKAEIAPQTFDVRMGFDLPGLNETTQTCASWCGKADNDPKSLLAFSRHTNRPLNLRAHLTVRAVIGVTWQVGALGSIAEAL